MFYYFRPDHYLTTIEHLDVEMLHAWGIRGILLDVDGTLKDFLAETIDDRISATLQRFRDADIRLCIYSNGRTSRIQPIADSLGIPFVAKACKPFAFAAKKGLSLLGVDAKNAAIIGDQIFADVLVGRLMGLKTILVVPSHVREPWFTRVKRPFERFVISRLGISPVGGVTRPNDALCTNAQIR